MARCAHSTRIASCALCPLCQPGSGPRLPCGTCPVWTAWGGLGRILPWGREESPRGDLQG